MKKQLRVYLATQVNCNPCEVTKKALKIKDGIGIIEGIPIYEVDLSSSPDRRYKMGVTATPTIFIVEGKDDDNDGNWEEVEEHHVWHQTGMITSSDALRGLVKALKEGKTIRTHLD